MRKVTGSTTSPAVAPPAAGRSRRLGVAGLGAVMALGTLPAVTGLGTAAHAAVTIGSNISVFPNRDMVVAVGYEPGEQLLVEVLRGGAVIGTTQGPAVETPEGVGLEVNHGPLGAPLPGDCWTGFTPDIIGGDVIRVTAVGRPDAPADTMTVQDVAFSGAPVLEADGSVSVSGTATPGTDFAVEFRRDKPDPRFRRGPFNPVFEPGTNSWKATFRPTATSAEGLSAEQQRLIALNEASWLAVADEITETTLAELGEPGGVGPGCNGTADPNSLVGGLEPINIASPDVTFSGTARAGVAAVSVTVGGLGARDAVLVVDPNGGPSTWTLAVAKADLATLPDGNVAVTPRFDTLVGATRTVLKDTVAPLAPVPSVAPGTYSATQAVALNKPAGEGTSKVYWEIGNAAVPDPDEFSNLYSGQIAVTSTQTLKGRLIDAAGNPGAVGSFAYRIGTPPAAPTGVTATESTTAAGAAVVRWNPAAGATGYNVYRNDLKVNADPLPSTATSFTDTAAGTGDHSYVVRAVEANGIESVNSNVASMTIAAPAVPAGLRATQGDARVTLNWTAATGVANYRVYRDGTALPTLVAGSASSYINTGLTNGTLYEYAITALDAGGNESARTGIVQAVPQVPADTTAPPAPSVNPATGTYTSAQTVTATNTEAGVTNRYTVGTGTSVPADPTTGSTALPAGGLPVSASSVVKVASFDAATNRSTVVTRTYTITTADTTAPPAPSVNPATGTYTSAQTVTATNTEAGVTNRYTVGTGTSVPADPTTGSTALPAGGLPVSASSVVKVASFDAATNRSTVVTRTYTINTPPPATGPRTLVIDANADAGVRQETPTVNNGTATSLKVDTQATDGNTATRATSYVRFAVPALASGESITGATLSLDVTNSTTNGPAIWRTASTWTETTMTFATGQPARSGTAAVGNFGTMAVGRVSTPVSGIAANSTVSFQLDPEVVDGLDFSSRETTARPQLTLTIGTGGTTTPAPAPDTTAPPAPTVNPATGTYTAAQTVTATNTEAGVTNRYTIGTGTTVPADPTTGSTALPAGGLPVSSSSVVKVASFDAATNRSTVVTRTYTINTPTTPTTRTIVVDATADAYVRQDTATTNYGTASNGTTLNVDSEYTVSTPNTRTAGYLRFTVPALQAGETITAASVSLNVTNATVNGPALWRTGTTWTENTMTWASGRPARSGTTAAGNFTSMAVGRVSTPVSGITAPGTVSFELDAEDVDGMQFSSRETTTLPQLILTIRTP
ncbi:DNRLRE domain-containing protein [Cellulomonas aerilata]|uniref:DNRLRE domain-containing protein n=1 Tax=Cellulomonas aerilata TaxID=515326 RepID=UPI0031CE5E6F